LWSYLFVKNTTKIKISASQRISIKNCMNYGHNKNVGLFKFQSGYRKLYLNSPKGISRKKINAQTACHRLYVVCTMLSCVWIRIVIYVMLLNPKYDFRPWSSSSHWKLTPTNRGLNILQFRDKHRYTNR